MTKRGGGGGGAGGGGPPRLLQSLQSASVNALAPRSFGVVKVNKYGKRQNRTVTVSRLGLQNEQGKGWFHPVKDVYSVWVEKGEEEEEAEGREGKRSGGGSSACVYASVVKKYSFELTSEQSANVMVKTVKLWGMARQERRSLEILSTVEEERRRLQKATSSRAAWREKLCQLRVTLEEIKAQQHRRD